MGKYYLTNKAVEDLSTIWLYTYDTWSEKQADKYYELILYYCKEIANNHTLGKNYAEIETELFGYKASEHIIFYRIIRKDVIEIIRILHSRMDLKNRIQE